MENKDEKIQKLKQIKHELKDLATEIRTHRAGRKETSPTHDQYDQSHDFWLSHRYRHRHIAYCLARGTAYEEIESPRADNTPCWHTIEGLLKTWGFEHETVCAHS